MKKAKIVFPALLVAVVLLCGVMVSAAAENIGTQEPSYVSNGVSFTPVEKYQYLVNGSPTGFVNYDIVYSRKKVPDDFPVGVTHWVKFYSDDPAITARIYCFVEGGKTEPIDLLVIGQGSYFTIPFHARGLIIRIHIDLSNGPVTFTDAHCGIMFFGPDGHGFEDLIGAMWQ